MLQEFIITHVYIYVHKQVIFYVHNRYATNEIQTIAASFTILEKY